MKSAAQYVVEHARHFLFTDLDGPLTMLESEAEAAVKAALADAQAEADRRVTAERDRGDRYRNLLVGAILRSGPPTHPLETQAMNAAHPAG